MRAFLLKSKHHFVIPPDEAFVREADRLRFNPADLEELKKSVLKMVFNGAL